MARQWIDFLFNDEETGEDFLVELEMDGSSMDELLAEAQRIADDNFDSAVFQEVVSAEDGEMMGLDTY
jgi:hypothetical protein